MSQEQNEGPFVPPPPPSSGNSMYPPHVLEAKTREASEEARTALIMAIIGMFCCVILGFLAFRRANHALEIMDMYDVAADKRGLATAAKILSIIQICLWAIGLVGQIFLATLER